MEIQRPSESIKFSRPLREHQRRCLDRFAFEPSMALLHEMGTGKTTTAIAWLRAKYNAAQNITPTLIVSPVATLYNWQDEFKINAPEKVCEQILVLYKRPAKTKRKGSAEFVQATGKERAEMLSKTEKRIIIVNPEAFDMPEVVAALKIFSPVNVVIDEVHRWKGNKLGSMKKPTRLAKLLSITDKATNCTVMTGTPILNNYMDLWSPWRILDRGETFGTDFFSHFRERYFQDRNASWKTKRNYFPDWQPKPGIANELAHKIARHSSRITKDECLDLPPLIFVERHAEMGEIQEKAYREIEEQLITEISEGTCAVTNALARVTRLLQILSGFVPVETEQDGRLPVRFQKNPRLDLLKELLKEITPHSKVIVWASYRESYPFLRELLKELKLEFAEITGDTKDKRKEEMSFQTDEACRVLIGNAQAGGVGINLTAASYAIYYSRNFSLGDRLQSEARCHRGGSEIHKKITIIDIVSRNTIDEDVLIALKRKQEFSNNVLGRIAEKYGRS